MASCPTCHPPATTRDGFDRRGRQRFACHLCHRDFTHASSGAFSGYRWPPEVIVTAVSPPGKCGVPKVHPNSAADSQTGYDQPPSMLLFVVYACLRLRIDLALAPLRDRPDQASFWCCATRSASWNAM